MTVTEGDLFFFGQGSPGMGMSRGKIHGIWVFGKFLLPLLSGGLLPEGFLRLVLSCYTLTGRSSLHKVSLSGVDSGLSALATCDTDMW